MIRRLVFIAVLIGAFVEAGPSVVWAGDVTVTVHKQVMAPTMELDPEKVTVQIGDTVTWENLTGQGIKVTPDWDETQPLPPYVRPGGTVRLRRSEEHTSELQSRLHLVCRLLLEKKKKINTERRYVNTLCSNA